LNYKFKNLIQDEATRVKLPEQNQDILSTYINANYIDGYKNEPKSFIATQGPMSHTIGDFWRMIWNERISCIVMITKLKERMKSKCEQYVPENEEAAAFEFEGIQINVNKVTCLVDYEIRQLTIKNSRNNEIRIVYHYWYTAWPDHKVPENPYSLIQLVKQVEIVQTFNEKNNSLCGPILVHCSAGIGRTGAFIALSIGMKQIDMESMVDIVQIVCRLRKNR
jgi:protein tyrosine phosphatase